MLYINRMALLFQNTEFTCGPVCLKMAMHRLDPARPHKEVNEFLIWREANSIFMGHGHPGCTPYGLANSAMKRGFSATLYSNDMPAIEAMFAEDALKDHEKKIYNLVHDHDRQAALDKGLTLNAAPFGASLLQDILDKGAVPLMLVQAFSDQEFHWVLIDAVEGDVVTVIDPYEKHGEHPAALEPDSDVEATHRLPFSEFSDYCLHGDKNNIYLILAIGRLKE